MTIPAKPTRSSAVFAIPLGLLLITGCSSHAPLPLASPTTLPSSPAPHLDAISPGIIPVSTTPITVTLIGGNFDANTHVLSGDVPSTDDLIPATYISSTQLQITIPSYYSSIPIRVPIHVFEDYPVTASGGAVPLFIVADKLSHDTSLVPSITSVLPTSIVAGRTNVQIILNGTNFNSTSTIEINGTARETVWPASNTLLTAIDVLSSDTATPGNLQITVINDPTVDPSAPATLRVVPQ